MASAAFRSTTRRSAVGAADDAGSSTRTPADGRRRYRSLSRGPGRFPPSTPEHDDFSTPRSRFVNKARGSGTEFPEISLDDLADEFFWARGKEEEDEIGRRSSRRVSDVSPRVESGLSRVRGRSQSKYFAAPETAKRGDGGPRRRRSVSVARNRCSDGENDMDLSRSSVAKNKSQSSVTSNFQQTALEKPNTSGCVMRRSMSQKDLFQAHDSYSSHSSSLTDDEACEGHTNKNGTEKTIQAVYSLEKMDHPTGDGEATGFYEAMRKEVRSAVGEIRTELEKVMVKPGPASMVNGDGGEPKSSKVIADIRNCTTKLEQSEKRKQELLAELAVEEQRGQELTKIVRELLPEPKENTTRERASRPRRRSNDRTMMSKRLDEEAERYFDEFLSNVEDTDVSSFDGERSDTSSVIGGNARRNFGVLNAVSETHVDLIKDASVPVETDEVTFPWLQWETSTDITHSPCKNKTTVPLELGSTFSIPTQDASLASEWCSFRSWIHDDSGSSSSVMKDVRVCRREAGRDQSEWKESTFDMDEYLLLQQDEELLFESLRQRQRIESGSLVVCRRSLI